MSISFYDPLYCFLTDDDCFCSVSWIGDSGAAGHGGEGADCGKDSSNDISSSFVDTWCTSGGSCLVDLDSGT